MGSSRNRARKRSRRSLSKKAKKIQDGGPNYKDPGPSAKKIDKNIAKFERITTDVSPDLKEGTIFMDLSTLFNVLEAILKCPKCNSDMSSHVDMNKRMASPITLCFSVKVQSATSIGWQ